MVADACYGMMLRLLRAGVRRVRVCPAVRRALSSSVLTKRCPQVARRHLLCVRSLSLNAPKVAYNRWHPLNFNAYAEQGEPRPLHIFGSPVLQQLSVDVDPMSPDSHQLVADMCATLASIGQFAGLAAPQIGVNKRVIVFCLWKDPSELPNGEAAADVTDPDNFDIPPTAVFNARYKAMVPEKDEEYEECFSVPYMSGPVLRPRLVRVTGVDLLGKDVDLLCREYEGRVLQHEIDHLDGIMWPNRVPQERHSEMRHDKQLASVNGHPTLSGMDKFSEHNFNEKVTNMVKETMKIDPREMDGDWSMDGAEPDPSDIDALMRKIGAKRDENGEWVLSREAQDKVWFGPEGFKDEYGVEELDEEGLRKFKEEARKWTKDAKFKEEEEEEKGKKKKNNTRDMVHEVADQLKEGSMSYNEFAKVAKDESFQTKQGKLNVGEISRKMAQMGVDKPVHVPLEDIDWEQVDREDQEKDPGGRKFAKVLEKAAEEALRYKTELQGQREKHAASIKEAEEGKEALFGSGELTPEQREESVRITLENLRKPEMVPTDEEPPMDTEAIRKVFATLKEEMGPGFDKVLDNDWGMVEKNFGDLIDQFDVEMDEVLKEKSHWTKDDAMKQLLPNLLNKFEERVEEVKKKEEQRRTGQRTVRTDGGVGFGRRRPCPPRRRA